MKNKILNCILGLALALTSFAAAEASAKKKSKNKDVSRLGEKLGTEHNFNELSVRGRYQSGFEGVAIVENEKGIEDLLDYRTNYNDRIQTSKSQR